jgi:hypothetical protein
MYLYAWLLQHKLLFSLLLTLWVLESEKIVSTEQIRFLFAGNTALTVDKVNPTASDAFDNMGIGTVSDIDSDATSEVGDTAPAMASSLRGPVRAASFKEAASASGGGVSVAVAAAAETHADSGMGPRRCVVSGSAVLYGCLLWRDRALL